MKRSWKPWVLSIAIPAAYALLMRVLFGLDPIRHFAAVMSISFFITVPFAIGYMTIAFSSLEKVRKPGYRIMAPWIPIFIFLGLTLMLAIEGWACWLMILPVFLIFASIGGWVAGMRKIKRADRPGKLQLSLVVLLPLLLAPLEKLLPLLPARYEAYTYTDIHAPASLIWQNVLRVRTIPQEADRGSLTRLLGFPRPIRAELNYAGVGGSREAIFSKGLVFQEVVREYADQQKMVFSIRADPHTIPSTTMDEHVIIGGEYFDVLDGTYRLEQRSDSVYRLHLYSHFTLKTSFNFYASWWAGMIMQDIQNNILRVIQTRCEEKL
ncbi:MAG TPA: hypothetical protein VGS79_08900 [Puia sp.]|nr:hypothetical protein [Puia sp.]